MHIEKNHSFLFFYVLTSFLLPFCYFTKNFNLLSFVLCTQYIIIMSKNTPLYLIIKVRLAIKERVRNDWDRMRTRIMGCLKCISLLLLLAFIGPGKSLLFHSDIDGSKDSLLLHSSNEPSTSAPIGPLGLETTVSILAMEIAMEITRLQADMKARDDKMKNQEVEILHLKTLLGESNATTSLLSNRVLDELHTLNSTVTEIKTDLDIINSAAGIQAILLKLNSMAQSIRYLTLSLTEQATMLDATNNSLQQDILNLKRELGTYASDIAVLKYNESSNFVNLQSQINGVKYSVNSLQTKTSSLQSHINSLESTSRSQQSSISMLQSKSAELSSSVTSLTSKLVDYFRHFVMDGFANGRLTSALQYRGKLTWNFIIKNEVLILSGFTKFYGKFK